MDFSFGNWVKRRRKGLDLTQQELAQCVGCSLATIVKIESDERRPSRQVAGLLAKHLEIPPDQLDLFLKVSRKDKTTDTLGAIPETNQPFPHPAPHLPHSPSPLVGREFEMAEISRLVLDPRCRLLTLTGQGGIGKTHLAIHTVLSFVEKEGQEISFVSLAPVVGREQVVTAIADALGIVLYAASDRADQLIAYLREKDLILVLDNFEHLTSDMNCVELIGDILQGTRRTKMIVTSRQPLQLRAEWVFEVEGLPVPNKHHPEELEASSAVILFIQRANQAAIGFKPTDQDLLAIAEICELVEGLPLGIELAAAWVRILPCEEIAREIQKSMDFLAAFVHDLPQRHRSMRAAIEHSWKLLNPDEQRMMRQLSIFRGGFSREAAEFVAGTSLSDMLALVSKSLVRRAETGRYDMHELIRQYALDRLREEAAELERTQMRHSQFFADLLEKRGPALKGAERSNAVSELISDLANLRQAWRWAAGHQQSGLLNQSADTLFWLYESRSNCREGIPLYDTAVEGLQDNKKALAESEDWARQLALGQALCYKGFFLFRQGKHPQGRDSLRASLAILQEIPERETVEFRMALSNTLIFLGTVTSVMGDFEEGDRLLQEGLSIKQELGDLWGSAFCLRQVGLSAHYRGEFEKSSAALEQSLAISKEIGNPWSIAASLNQLGLDAHARGEDDEARKYLLEALKMSRSLEDRASIAEALDGLALVSARQDRDKEARAYFQESIALWNEIGELGKLAQTLIHYGEALLKSGDIDAAHEQFKDSLTFANRAQITPVLLEALIGEADILLTKGEVESAFSIVWAVSQDPASFHATRELAKKLYTDLEARLNLRDFEDRQARTSNLEEIVKELLSTSD